MGKCINCKNGKICSRCNDMCQERVPAHLFKKKGQSDSTVGYAPRNICSCEDYVVIAL